MANTGSYNSDKASDVDYGIDPASGGFFNSDYKKNDDLKQMLDVNKDSMKLEAMKRIIGMMAKGRNASDLFPSVVKNVVSKNIEVKKLVYVYLARYAEEQQDLALLSISTFQRALKDPNQLIRASALRVLSSIRVPMIIPIVMLAIQDSSVDMSPYVRKTAAHAIPKLYSLDPDQKEELVLVIEKLLQDKTTLVVGSAVMAFEEVCPERTDMIHKSYRKLCNLLVDVDEWGQVFILNMLTRYARTQFTNPNLNENDSDDDLDGDLDNGEDKRPFYDDETNQLTSRDTSQAGLIELDPDHRLLLKNAKPLLQSRNAAVVMAVAQLFHHLAPRREVAIIARALVRLLRASREVQTIVLTTIVSLAIKRKALFVPYLKSFFVRSSDPTHVKTLKLELLTTLASEASIASILREFQTYISSVDKAFVAATVQAIGKCAANISQVTDTCLTGLVSLLSYSDEAVVAESVVVIKNLLQTKPEAYTDIICHMVRLSDSITVPTARAAILWLLGEYSHLVPRLGPDVLRKAAKTFIQEEDIVKLQVINLSVKLYLTNPEQTTLLCQYVLSLARYDQNYDVRDRARTLRQLLFPVPSEDNTVENRFTSQARSLFLVSKPAPVPSPTYPPELDQFQLGSLSHHIRSRASGYHELPPWATSPSDPTLRQTASPPPPASEDRFGLHRSTGGDKGGDKVGGGGKEKKSNAFYTSGSEEESETEEEEEESGGSEEEEGSSGSEEESGSSSEEDGSSEESESGSADSEEGSKPQSKNKKQLSSVTKKPVPSIKNSNKTKAAATPSNQSKPGTTKPSSQSGASNKTTSETARSNLDLLLDLDDLSLGGAPTMMATPTLGGFLSPMTPMSANQASGSNGITPLAPSYTTVRYTEAMNRISQGHGMLSVQAAYSRGPCLASPQMITISLRLTNHSTVGLNRLRLDSETASLGQGMSLHPFPEIPTLGPGLAVEVSVGVNLNDSTQPLSPRIEWEVEDGAEGTLSGHVKLAPPVGEWIRAVTMSQPVFDSEKGKLTGMNEHKSTLGANCTLPVTPSAVYQVANVGLVHSNDTTLRFAGTSVSSGCLTLVTISNNEVMVNCEKMVLGSMLLNELIKHLNNI
uniref:AP-3 complex subunit beta n=1 Tax=Cacopsylla melanoneura TaxID=428564 RepID=A0A8D8PUZ3_9HEMI